MESSRRRALRAGVLEWAVHRGAPCGSVLGGWRMAAGVLVLRGGAAERQGRGDNEDTDMDTMQYAEAKQWAKRQMSELEDRKKHLRKELYEEEYGDDEPDPDAKAANISRSERMNNSLAEHGASYTEMMLRFGVTKEYLAKVVSICTCTRKPCLTSTKVQVLILAGGCICRSKAMTQKKRPYTTPL